MEKTPPAPSPQQALAAMKLPMLCAVAHHAVVAKNTAIENKYTGLRPKVSEIRPNRGRKAVEVKRKAVDSHEAELEAWKWDVMTGWVEAINVESKKPIIYPSKTPLKITQNRKGETLIKREA
ncbi:hypothetical protein ATERTT37_003307 [Aspergillus terreus]